MKAARNIAFEAPDMVKMPCPSKGRPIDLVHLACQTMGDKDLEAEALKLFARQARQSADALAGDCDAETVKAVAHRLKGAALAVGAHCVARSAEAIETGGGTAARIEALRLAVTEAENFICGLLR